MRRVRFALLLVLALALALPAGGLLLPTDAEAGPSTRTAALVQKVQKQRLSRVVFEDESLPNVVKWLRVATGINFHIKAAAIAKAGLELDDVRITTTLEQVTVATFLKIALEGHDLAAVAKGNIVFITTKKDAWGKPLTRLFGIAHITWTKRDFIAPEISLGSAEDIGDEYEPEVEVENDPLNNGDAVAELIKELVFPKGWQENDDWEIKATDQYLVIRAPRQVLAQIPAALDKIASMK